MKDLGAIIPEVPEQQEGLQKDFSASQSFPGAEAAESFFRTSRSRLLNVNRWKQICEGGAEFQLFTQSGQQKDSFAEIGDHIRIDVPGPGTRAGEGFDWVKIEELAERDDRDADTSYIIMRVRPAPDPVTMTAETAHFFSDKATSNFVVFREAATVYAAVLGRNEVINTEEKASFADKIRNFFVGAGAKAGLADPQWKSLVQGILKKEHKN